MKKVYFFINTVNKNYPSFMVFGDKGEVFFREKFIDKQENLVKKLKIFFEKYKIPPKDIMAVLAINGPGSFVGSRAGVTLANSFSFLYEIPILGVEDMGSSALELIKNNLKRLKKIKKNSVASVYYSREPNITVTKTRKH